MGALNGNFLNERNRYSRISTKVSDTRKTHIKIQAVKEEGKYFFICTHCGFRRKLKVMELDLLLRGGEKKYSCSKCPRIYRITYNETNRNAIS